MHTLLAILSLLTGFSIGLLPMSTGFLPWLGLTPLKLGHRRPARIIQVVLLWILALGSLRLQPSAWGWIALAFAPLFTVLAVRFYPRRVFVALDQPNRSQAGLSDSAPVLMVAAGEQVVAYPMDLIAPHHIH